MGYDEISKKSTNKYRSKFDMIQIRTEQGKRDKIAEHAKSHGESLNAFINRAIDTQMKLDNEEIVVDKTENE